MKFINILNVYGQKAGELLMETIKIEVRRI